MLSFGNSKTAELEAKLQALDKSQAVIEFTPEGTILFANDNFLKALKAAFSIAGISINDFATTTMSEAQILDMTRKFEQDYIFGNK